MTSPSDIVTLVLQTLWRSVIRYIPGFTRVADHITHVPIPFGLSSNVGTLYGWNMHEKLHAPEPETVAFFKRNLKEGNVIADIGANIGYFSLLFSKLVGNTGQVVSFEPSPKAHERLVRATQNIKNITTVNKGVFSTNDTLTLYAARPGDPMGSFMYKRGKPTASIPVLPLRDYPTSFTFAKIDVEGAELEVLRGMKAPIPAVIEVARGIIAEHHNGVEAFFAQIEAMGYSIHLIIEGGETVPYSKETLPQLRDNVFLKPHHTS
jgi:FkbM family methyltransferase